MLRIIGAAALAIARETGGIVLLLGRVLRSLVPPQIDGRELVRNLYKMGNQSVPIVALTAFFTGGVMLVQTGIFVRRFGATGLVGWAAGYTIFREIGPILIGLMFSGRVGAHNTAELGTMTVTEQLDGLRALAIEPIGFLIVPRVVAMMIALFCLVVVGNVVAITGGALFGKLLLNVELSSFFHSFADNLKPWDLSIGLVKAVVFGLAISITSCHFGTSVKGGAVGVGRAVNNAVVAAAVAIMISDNLITMVLR
jgi:phospholipid/cholesterol/gamma-HCH transport system permease protein